MAASNKASALASGSSLASLDAVYQAVTRLNELTTEFVSEFEAADTSASYLSSRAFEIRDRAQELGNTLGVITDALEHLTV